MANLPQKWYMMDHTAVIKNKTLTEPLMHNRKKKGAKEEYDDLYNSSDEDISEDEEEDVEQGNSNGNSNGNSDREGGEDGDTSEAEEEKKPLGSKFWYVTLASLGSLGVNGVVAYLVVAGSITILAPIVLVPALAGALAFVVSGFAVYREKQITGTDSVRAALNLVRGQVNGMKKQNKRLGKSRRQMGRELRKLKECEENLKFAVEQNGASVDEFVELVEENQQIMCKMKSHFDAKVVQDCVRIIIKYDKDNDFILSTKEMPMLIYALKSFDIQIESEADFKATLQDKSVSVAIQYVTDLLDAQTQKEAEADKYGLSKPEAIAKIRKVVDV